MVKHPRRKPFSLPSRSLVLAAASWALVALTGMGCSDHGKGPIDKMTESLFPPSPGQIAREAFNVYDADKRRRAIDLLSAAEFGGEASYLRLYRLLIDDPDATVRASAAKALGNHGDPTDVPVLVRRLNDDTAGVRWEAAKALQKIHGSEAIEPLMQVTLKDEDADVRMAAAYALGQYPEVPVFQNLLSALDDSDFGVRFTSSESLATLTGQDFGPDGTRWLEWSKQNQGKLFAGQQKYTWQPFVKPRGFWDKAKFWKDAPVVPPREARSDVPTTQPQASATPASVKQ